MLACDLLLIRPEDTPDRLLGKGIYACIVISGVFEGVSNEKQKLKGENVLWKLFLTYPYYYAGRLKL